MHNPLKTLTKREWILWITSLIIVFVSNILSPHSDTLTLIAALTGITGVLYEGKGDVWGQIIMVVFSILYGIISYNYRYWGEMITYMGMAMPMAIWAIITWLKNPSQEDATVVKIQKLSSKQLIITACSTIVVTALFFFVLKALETPNLLISTVSITTSFAAAALTMLRSSYYALWYALNDLVLIILWLLASKDDPGYIPVVINFCIFFVNDVYALSSWMKREKVQFASKDKKTANI